MTMTGPTTANRIMQTKPGIRNSIRPTTVNTAARMLARTSRSVGSLRRISPSGRPSSPFWSTATMRSTTPEKKTRLSVVPATLSAVPDVHMNTLSTSDDSAKSLARVVPRVTTRSMGAKTSTAAITMAQNDRR